MIEWFMLIKFFLFRLVFYRFGLPRPFTIGLWWSCPQMSQISAAERKFFHFKIVARDRWDHVVTKKSKDYENEKNIKRC